MKRLFPILSLAAVACFLIYQEVAIANLKNENETPPAATQTSPNNRQSSNLRASWKSFLSTWPPSKNQEDLGALLKQRAVLAAMDRDELLDGLDQLSKLDLDEKVKEEIHFSILQFLAPLDPATTLALADKLPDQNSSQVISFKLNTFKFLTHQDSTQAAQWLDEKIRDQSFTSTRLDQLDTPRFKFEKTLLSKLIDSNLPGAQARIDRLNDEEKGRLFGHDANYWQQGGRVPAAFLELARTNFTPYMASVFIGEVLGAQKTASLGEATTLLDQSKLTESERKTTAKELLLNHLREEHTSPDFEKIYQWTQVEDAGGRTHLMTNAINQLNTYRKNAPTLKTEELIGEVFSLVDTTGDQAILENYLANRSGTIGASLEREIDSFKDKELAQRFRTALQK